MGGYGKDWYYREQDPRGQPVVRGPVSFTGLRSLVKDGKIHGWTLVRRGPDPSWRPVKEVLPLVQEPGPETFSVSVRPDTWKKILLAVVLFIACLVAGKWALFSGKFSAFHEGGSSAETLTREAIVALTNEERQAKGLPSLVENVLLDAVAEERARDMIDKQYFAHVSPSGEQASDGAQKTGYRYRIIAENIAQGPFTTNRKLVAGWMQSPGHRKNILSPDIRDIGVSVQKGKIHGEETWVGVQIFGLQSSPVSDESCTRPSEGLLDEIRSGKAEMHDLEENLARLRQELERESTYLALEHVNVGKDYRGMSDLGKRISGYNEKVDRYHQQTAHVKERQAALDTMVEEYNRAVRDFRQCQASN